MNLSESGLGKPLSSTNTNIVYSIRRKNKNNTTVHQSKLYLPRNRNRIRIKLSLSFLLILHIIIIHTNIPSVETFSSTSWLPQRSTMTQSFVQSRTNTNKRGFCDQLKIKISTVSTITRSKLRNHAASASDHYNEHHHKDNYNYPQQNKLRAKQLPHKNLTRRDRCGVVVCSARARSNHSGTSRLRSNRSTAVSSFSYQPVQVFLNGKVYNNNPSTSATQMRRNRDGDAHLPTTGSGIQRNQNQYQYPHSSSATRTSSSLNISSGFTFDGGDQLLVSTSKPLGLVLEEKEETTSGNIDIDSYGGGGGGCFVAQIMEQSNAQSAGVQIGDVLVAVQNVDVSHATLEEVMDRIANAPRVVNLRFWRSLNS